MLNSAFVKFFEFGTKLFMLHRWRSNFLGLGVVHKSFTYAIYLNFKCFKAAACRNAG